MKILYRYDSEGNFINSYTERFILANPELTKDWILNENRPEIPIVVPDQVALWCLRQILKDMGLFELIVTEFDKLEEPTRTRALDFLEYGNFVTRNSQTVLLLGHLLNKSKEEIDQIFINANNIEL